MAPPKSPEIEEEEDQEDPEETTGDTPNGLIFYDFVFFSIWNVLGKPFMGFLFEISKKIHVDTFFHIQSKGGTLLYV